MKAFNAPLDIIEDAILDASPVVEIWLENAEVFNFFLRLMTQWNMVPTFSRIIRTGLKYESVESLMRIEEIKDKSKFFGDLQTIEFAALSVFNEVSE